MEPKLSQQFEDFLRGKFAETYSGTKDDMPDAFNDWLVMFDVGVWLYWAEEYAKSEVAALANEAWRLADNKSD